MTKETEKGFIVTLKDTHLKEGLPINTVVVANDIEEAEKKAKEKIGGTMALINIEMIKSKLNPGDYIIKLEQEIQRLKADNEHLRSKLEAFQEAYRTKAKAQRTSNYDDPQFIK